MLYNKLFEIFVIDYLSNILKFFVFYEDVVSKFLKLKKYCLVQCQY